MLAGTRVKPPQLDEFLMPSDAPLRAAVEGDPKLADGWNQLGILLDKTGRRPEALAAFTRAIASGYSART